MTKINKNNVFYLHYKKNLENLDYYKKFYAKYWEKELSLAERVSLRSIIDELSRLINEYEVNSKLILDI